MLQVVQQDRGPVAAVIHLTSLGLPGTVATLELEIDLFQQIPVIREGVLLEDSNIAVVHSQRSFSGGHQGGSVGPLR